MKNSKAVNVVLFISGLIAAIIGGAILFKPVIFYASNGIDLDNNINLLNEIRASGGALLAAGLLILSGCFVSNLRYTAIVVSTLLYLAYGVSRVLSFTVDGIPSEGLILATGLEIFLGVVCAWFYVKYRGNFKN